MAKSPGQVDAEFLERKQKLAQAYLDASRTLEGLRDSPTSEEMVKYYLQQPESLVNTVLEQERKTLDNALALEVDAIRDAPDELTLKMALEMSQGVVLMMRVLNVVEFLAKGLFTTRDDLGLS